MTTRLPMLLMFGWLSMPGGVAAAQRAGDSITVLPGNSLLDPARLIPHRVTWRVTRRDPDGGGTVQGLWTDTWVRSTDGGRAVFVFHQLFVDTTGAVLYGARTEFDATTFRAISSTQETPPSGLWVTYRYAGDTVSGTLRTSATTEPRDFQVVFNAPVWDPLTPVTLLVPLETFEPGTVVRYPVWDQRPGVTDDVTWSEMRVDSLGVDAAQGGAVKVWHVTYTPIASVPNAVFRLSRSPTPPYAPWFVVERANLIREWSLVDWEPFTRSAQR